MGFLKLWNRDDEGVRFVSDIPDKTEFLLLKELISNSNGPSDRDRAFMDIFFKHRRGSSEVRNFIQVELDKGNTTYDGLMAAAALKWDKKSKDE